MPSVFPPKLIRRETVRRPHKNSEWLLVHRWDGTPVRLHLRDLACWIEYERNDGDKVVVVRWHQGSSTAVVESFDQIDDAVNGKVATHE